MIDLDRHKAWMEGPLADQPMGPGDACVTCDGEVQSASARFYEVTLVNFLQCQTCHACYYGPAHLAAMRWESRRSALKNSATRS